MALREGRCPNCGSILFLDSSAEKGHCLYCDCVFENKKAFSVAKIAEEDPSYEFPNEEQPKYEGPSLHPKQHIKEIDFKNIEAAAKEKPATAGSSLPPSFDLTAKKDVQIKVPPRIKKIFIAGGLGFVLLFLAITVPSTLKRDREREAIAKSFAAGAEKLSGEKSWKNGENFLIHGFSNYSVTLLLQKPVDQAGAKRIFEEYCSIREEVSGKQEDDVIMTIATEKGGWRIKGSDVLGQPEIKEIT